MSCPVCKRAKCRWIETPKALHRVSTENLQRIFDHNLSYIEMVYRDGEGGAHNEERAYDSLTPIAEELGLRRRGK